MDDPATRVEHALLDVQINERTRDGDTALLGLVDKRSSFGRRREEVVENNALSGLQCLPNSRNELPQRSGQSHSPSLMWSQVIRMTCGTDRRSEAKTRGGRTTSVRAPPYQAVRYPWLTSGLSRVPIVLFLSDQSQKRFESLLRCFEAFCLGLAGCSGSAKSHCVRAAL